MIPNWVPASAGESPLTDVVQIWRLQLPLEDLLAGRLAAHLTVEESDRAARFLRETDRCRFLAGRGGLRALLAAQLGVSPGEVRLAQSVRGKPVLAENLTPRIDFNVAHSGQVVLIAVSLGAEVGVDVEATRPLPDALGLAERFFVPSEAAVLTALPEAERPAVFRRLWTRKESVLKAAGTGLEAGLATFEVSSGTEATVRSVAGDSQAAAHWTLCEFQPAPQHLGCVAVRRHGARFVLHDFKLSPGS